MWWPVYTLVREWRGREASARYDERQALRSEVRRLAGQVEQAITALRNAGQGKKAAALERALGVRIEAVRHASAEVSEGSADR
jgi:hypothetical protein